MMKPRKPSFTNKSYAADRGLTVSSHGDGKCQAEARKRERASVSMASCRPAGDKDGESVEAEAAAGVRGLTLCLARSREGMRSAAVGRQGFSPPTGSFTFFT
ncbi:hypothetical protein E2C01_029170 [Portunus trituberculatus]|uniref:Uncharacterized protein n=1 Tax=Portunus trituberculatus TaxID=210409 RepID=A0A5B7ER54_PORTR|nr:hypothetical protein [Portunus trituberculatus]